jgi:hypothetical protein
VPPMPPVGMPLAAHAIPSTALPLAPGGASPQTQRPFPDQGQTPPSKGAFDAAAAAMYPPINHPPTSSASSSSAVSALHSPQAASCAACGTYLGKSLMSRLGVTAESTARRCARCHGSFCDSCFKNDSVQNDMCKGVRVKLHPSLPDTAPVVVRPYTAPYTLPYTTAPYPAPCHNV